MVDKDAASGCATFSRKPNVLETGWAELFRERPSRELSKA
jgi:hypothetical protein